MRTAIFGGTFNPPHQAHYQIARSVIDTDFVDEVLFIPAAVPPHKVDIPITDFHHRFQMLKLMVADQPGLVISDIESKRIGEPSYTYKTVTELKRLFPEKDFYLLIGSDSLVQLHSWYKSQELVRECPVLTYPRPGITIDGKKLEKFWSPAIVKGLMSRIVQMELLPVSSTEIRKRVAKHRGIEGLVCEKVMDYIYMHALYV